MPINDDQFLLLSRGGRVAPAVRAGPGGRLPDGRGIGHPPRPRRSPLLRLGGRLPSLLRRAPVRRASQESEARGRPRRGSDASFTLELAVKGEPPAQAGGRRR